MNKNAVLFALMVWLLPGAEGSRVMIIIIIIYLVSLTGFSHIFAGSVDCAYQVVRGEASWWILHVDFFVPTLLGNIVAGVALVAAFSYGQGAPEIGRQTSEPGGGKIEQPCK